MRLQIPRSTLLPGGETGHAMWRHRGFVWTSYLKYRKWDCCLRMVLPAPWPAAWGWGGGGHARLKHFYVVINTHPHEKQLTSPNVLQMLEQT